MNMMKDGMIIKQKRWIELCHPAVVCSIRPTNLKEKH